MKTNINVKIALQWTGFNLHEFFQLEEVNGVYKTDIFRWPNNVSITVHTKEHGHIILSQGDWLVIQTAKEIIGMKECPEEAIDNAS